MMLQLESLTKYKEATACLTAGPEIIIDEPTLKDAQEKGETDNPQLISMNGSSANGRQNMLLSSSSSSSSSSATSPARLAPEAKKVKQVILFCSIYIIEEKFIFMQ